MRIIIYAVIVVFTAIVGLATCLYFIHSHSNRTEYDSKATSIEMEEYFFKHESDLDIVKEMYIADNFPGRIWQKDIGNKVDKKISPKRISEYQKKIRSLKIFSIGGNESYFQVTMITEGIITTRGCLKGFVYFSSMGDTASFSPLNQAKTNLKKLKDSWYLYVSCSGD